MELLAARCDIDGFFRRLSGSSRSLLMLDYDGTLAPFKVIRSTAFPYPEIHKCVRRLSRSENTRVVIVSGRSASEVVELLGIDPRPEIWGSHGVERLLPNGSYHSANVKHQFRELLNEAEQELESQGLASVAESKLCGTAVHWRGLPPAIANEVRLSALRAWSPLVRGTGLRIREFDGGLELRVTISSKGAAVRQIMAEEPEGIPAAYLGDDFTDEDAFEALAGRALTVLVRREYRSTAAQVWLRPPDELLTFLTDWSRAIGGAS